MQRLKIGVLAGLTLLTALVWYAIWQEGQRELTVAFLNVGQGDAIYIEAPNGNQLLIDGGRGRAVLRELGAVIPLYDRSIDVVLVTHPDADHIGGLIPVLESYRVGAVIESGNERETAVTVGFERAVAQEGALRVAARRGMRVDLGDGAVFTILYPDRNVARVESNEASIVGQLRYGSTTVLLTGDAPASVERILIAKDGSGLQSTVLKPGHHGSRSSSVLEFLAAVSPELAVISAGTGNSYGHPHTEVLARLAQLNIRALRTDMEGRIVLESDGNRVSVKQPLNAFLP